MRRLILVLTLPLMIFIFSLAPNAGAQGMIEVCEVIPDGVKRVYICVLECQGCDPVNPQCDVACAKLEDRFSGIETCNFPCILVEP